jgi:hypothetical protein
MIGGMGARIVSGHRAVAMSVGSCLVAMMRLVRRRGRFFLDFVSKSDWALICTQISFHARTAVRRADVQDWWWVLLVH